MVKVDIISGFLGAGKTTLIKNLFKSSMKNEKVVLIENEFGEIGVDGTFLKESGVEIKEINSGCICCSLVGDFSSSMKEVVDKFGQNHNRTFRRRQTFRYYKSGRKSRRRFENQYRCDGG